MFFLPSFIVLTIKFFAIAIFMGIADANADANADDHSDCPDELTSLMEEDCRSFNSEENEFVRLSTTFKNPFDNTEGLVNDPLMLVKGSGAFRRCQMMTSMPWKQLIESIKGKGGKVKGEEFKAFWKTKMDLYLNGKDEFDDTGLDKSTFKLNKGQVKLLGLYNNSQEQVKINQILEQNKTRERMEYFKNSLEGLHGKAREWKGQVRACTALAVLTMDGDFTQKDFPARVSADKKLSCAAQGIETRDYGPCINVVNIYDAAVVATMGVKTVQGMDYQSHLHEEENKLFENQMNSNKQILEKKEGEDGEDGPLSSEYDNNQITAPLKAQKSTVEKQKGYAEQRIVLHGAQAAALFAAASAIPKPSDLVKKCTKVINGQTAQEEYGKILSFINGMKTKYLEPYKNSLDGEFLNDDLWNNLNNEILSTRDTESNSELNEAICWEGFRSGAVVTHPLNQQSKDGATALAIQAGVQAGTSVAQAVMLGDQANRLQEIIDGVKKHKPEEEHAYDFNEDKDCKLNPMHPGCKNKEEIMKDVGFSNNPIIISGGNLAKAPGTLETSDGGKKVAEGDIPHVDPSSEGRIIPDSSSGGGSNKLESLAPMAKIKKGGGGTRGGGGLSVKSVSAPGGGKKRGRSRTGPRKTSASGTGLSAAYGGGKGVAYKGSGKGRRSKKNKSKNPFANMFKKGKKKKSVLNFRDIAGKKTDGNIWTMISRRYKKVHKKKRLLQYISVK